MSSNSSSTADCLETRYWYSFLASSLIVFFAGIAFISFYRFFVWICCQRAANTVPPPGASPKVANHSGTVNPPPQKRKGSASVNATNNAGAPAQKSPDSEIGYITEAKDWAGELISGQTTTGRILVSSELSYTQWKGALFFLHLELIPTYLSRLLIVR